MGLLIIIQTPLICLICSELIQKGDIIITGNGIYFQPYDLIEKKENSNYDELGYAVSIASTGVFGALRYQDISKELAKYDINDISKKIRESKGLSKLIEAGLVEFISWKSIKKIKKKLLTRIVVIESHDGHKIEISDDAKKNMVFDYIKERID